MNSNMRTSFNSKDIIKLFDAEWSDGNPPLIEAIMYQTPDNIRNRIFSPLIRIEMTHRRIKDQNLSLEEWQNRFPDRTDELEMLYLKQSLAIATSRMKRVIPVEQGCATSLDELFVYQFKPGSLHRMIVIDPAFQAIHFRHCHKPRSFWPVPSPKWHSCLFREIRSASTFTMQSQDRRRHTSLSISTETGKVVVPKLNNDFQVLREKFVTIVPENDEAFLVESQVMPIVACYGTIVGLLLGAFLARNGSDAVLAGSTIAGSIGGAILSYIMVLASNGKAFYPLLHGMLGMIIGGAAIFPMFGFNLTFPRIFMVCLPSFVLGVMIGAFRMYDR
ncbi:MAG TPA: hypothetical protein DD473_27525 [Planctomycetaceae bacterium]|nr:hypothetical protein [Planctomycetaceae bacterium]